MGTQALRNMISHGGLMGVAVLVVIGAALNRASASEAAYGVRLTPLYFSTTLTGSRVTAEVARLAR